MFKTVLRSERILPSPKTNTEEMSDDTASKGVEEKIPDLSLSDFRSAMLCRCNTEIPIVELQDLKEKPGFSMTSGNSPVVTLCKKKRGQACCVTRLVRLPLLPSGPGGVRQPSVAQNLTSKNHSMAIVDKTHEWSRGESNPRPPECDSGALPTELLPRFFPRSSAKALETTGKQGFLAFCTYNLTRSTNECK